MDVNGLIQLVQEIVKNASSLKNKYTNESRAPVNYACVFCQSNEQYKNLVEIAQKVGTVIEETPTGPLFHTQPIYTIAGKLHLLKIRKPDTTRPELGDADFTVSDYIKFKNKHLSENGFKLKFSNYISIKNFEMIELIDPHFNVRAYFSNPPLDKHLGVVIS